jgi:hypothetical protein
MGSPSTRESGAVLLDRDQHDTQDALGRPTAVPQGGWRDRVRSKPGLRELYRVCVFLVGLVFILGGVALAVLPGPLTIPPVLIGLWIWSTEFRFAKRLFQKFQVKARQAWAHAKAHPVSSALVTVGGLVLAGAVIWAVGHFQLVDRAKDAVL